MELATIISFLWYSIRTGVPLLFGTVGESIIEKSGSLNLGVEGMMAVGGILGYLIGCACDSLFMAFVGAFLTAGMCGLIFAFLTVTLKANQNVTGLTMTIFGVGLYRFIGQTSHDQLKTYLSIPEHLESLLDKKPLPGLSEIPVIGEIFFDQGAFVYIAVAIAVACWIYMKYTKKGLQMRAIGENPGAADAVGIEVNRSKYFNIILGSGIIGIGGLFLGMVINQGGWNENWINGYGWISIALVIFANWSPARAIFGSLFFGMLMNLQVWASNLASAFPATLTWMINVPSEVYQLLPFLVTALVLILTSIINKKQSGPAALGLNYFREDR